MKDARNTKQIYLTNISFQGLRMYFLFVYIDSLRSILDGWVSEISVNILLDLFIC